MLLFRQSVPLEFHDGLSAANGAFSEVISRQVRRFLKGLRPVFVRSKIPDDKLGQ
jgi:hypothetical protein